MKKCMTCNEEKMESEFYVNVVDGKKFLRGECKPCLQLRQAAGRFNIPLAKLKEMYVLQNFKCKICKKECDRYKNLSIDHDHKCCPENGKSCGLCVRGLLCSNCNHGLGNFKDDPKLLLNAIEYLGL